MSQVHIPREHQSAPKESPAEKVVREARQEIADGKFVPERKTGVEGFFDDGESGWLAQHPRVQEVLGALEYATRKKTDGEYVEKALMLHELNETVKRAAKWDGQGRWQGRENIEARLTNQLHIHAFVKKLNKAGVTTTIGRQGHSRIWLDEHAVRLKPGAESGICGVYAEVTGEAAREAHFGVIENFRRVGDSGGMKGMTMPQIVQFMADWKEAVAGYKGRRPAVVRVAKFHSPIAPEWSVLHFDKFDCPTSERYIGWRTTLLQMILRGVVTEAEVLKGFGEARGKASMFYQKQLHEYRNRMLGLDAQGKPLEP